MEKVYTGGRFGRYYNWGFYHSITADLWSTWTVPEFIENYHISQFGTVDNQTTYQFATEQLTITDIEGNQTQMDFVALDSTNEFLTFSIGEDSPTYNRLDYTWSDIGHLYICQTGEDIPTQAQVESTIEHCWETGTEDDEATD